MNTYQAFIRYYKNGHVNLEILETIKAESEKDVESYIKTKWKRSEIEIISCD